MSVTVAICQTEGRFADPDAALVLLADEAAAAKQAGADLLLLPELFLTGYNLGRERARRLAVAAGERHLVRARAIARETHIALCFGYPERVGDTVANSALVIDEAGTPILNYRKAHLFGEIDRAMFSLPGTAFPTARWRGLTLGLAICYDIEFPETARSLALEGADLVLVPTALMPPYDVVADSVIPARAYENQIYLAYANRCGAEDGLAYIGRSSICGPDGAVLAKAGAGAGRIAATLDPAHLADVRARDSLLADRLPALYGRIVE